MTMEYACTRKQFNKNLSEFGLIQVLMVMSGCAKCALTVPAPVIPCGMWEGDQENGHNEVPFRKAWAEVFLSL